MTEYDIEKKVCDMFTALDVAFLSPASRMTAREYDDMVNKIHDWANRQYALRYPQWDKAS